jgi:ubiquinone/menaquinone biosynthesis C-methylase UbiE
MSATEMIFHLLLERVSLKKLDRIPESHLVMDDPGQAESFMDSSHDDGILVPIHFYHALQGSSLVKPGDTVLELACGPANQLSRMAQLNPEAQFIGLDASEAMLNIARDSLSRDGITNVKLMHGNMSSLTDIDDLSVDCVICTMSLHHLPDLSSLADTFSEIRRVLKTGGGLYIADFGRLKRRSTQRFFAYDRSEEQSSRFTTDYLESLAAAFSVEELRNATNLLGLELKVYETIPAPFMVIIKNADRRDLDAATKRRAVEMYDGLTSIQKRDFNNIARWFRLTGYGLRVELD